jgi:hypothetical protein
MKYTRVPPSLLISKISTSPDLVLQPESKARLPTYMFGRGNLGSEECEKKEFGETPHFYQPAVLRTMGLDTGKRYEQSGRQRV